MGLHLTHLGERQCFPIVPCPSGTILNSIVFDRHDCECLELWNDVFFLEELPFPHGAQIVTSALSEQCSGHLSLWGPAGWERY